MSLANLSKVLKCAGSDDIVTLKANDDGDTVTFMFESPSEFRTRRRVRPCGNNGTTCQPAS
jgi:hypothetical protein